MADYKKRPEDQDTNENNKESKIEDPSEFIYKALKRFKKAESAEADNRIMALDDIKFKSGDQWPDQIRAQRTIEKRPCLTINKLKTFVHQITNDQRQNRPAIKISPIGDKSDPETAKMLGGLIRHIERNCSADVAYDTAFDCAVTMGWGYWRVITDYEDEDSFDQVIKVCRIRNPFKVYLDPAHSEPDGSDAEWVFITEEIRREDFEDLYPDADTMAWQEEGIGDTYKEWSTQDKVRVAEYFYTDKEARKLVRLKNGHVGYEDELDDSLKSKIKEDPDFVFEEREVLCKKIKYCKMTAVEILEESEWPGKWIPVIKVIGDEVDIDGKQKLAGIVRDAKDPQRMYNFWCTSETELIALAPKAPWVMEEGQIEGHENQWKQANNKSLPYLLYKSVNVAGKPAAPPQRQQFAGPPTGVVQAKISAAQDMQAVTGIRFDATMQERSYDESGKALRELKRVGDLGNFHYIDNLSRSLKHTGRIFIDLIPKIYDTPRVLAILREDGSEQQIKIDPQQGVPHMKGQDMMGRVQHIYNPKLGNYDVAVTIGPSFSTKRAEAADSMLMFMKNVPQAAPFIGDLIAKNMDWPGADEISGRLASMLPPHMQNKQLDQLPPEARALVSNLMQQSQQLKQERDKAVMMLGDQEKDREIERAKVAADMDGINKDFEAKLSKIQADFIAKMAAIEVKTAESKGEEAAMKADVQLQKVAADFEAKITKIAADHHAKIITEQMKTELLLQQAEERAKASEEKKEEGQAEKKGKQPSPVNFIVNMPSKKKRIRKEKDGSFIAEEIEE